MSFQFQPFSRKQRQLLNWWRPGSGVEDRRIVLADGAIRSGKTVAMILSFLLWSLSSFRGQDFILAGVTSGALARNVLGPMLAMLETLGVPAEWKRGEARVLVGGNSYYLFGADKDNAQDKLQGMTAAGAYADEAALFPRSFIDQMIGRCSVEGSRIFLNCNPNGAYHYLKTDFIDRAEEIGLYRLHFTMDDNLTLSPQIRESYARSFSGVFYRQYILGEWVSAEGAVYPMWDDRANTFLAEERGEEEIPFRDMRRFCAVDYGTVNPCVFLDVRDDGKTFWIMKEYYWDSACGAAASGCWMRKTTSGRASPPRRCSSETAWSGRNGTAAPRSCGKSTAMSGTTRPAGKGRNARSRTMTTPWTPSAISAIPAPRGSGDNS